MYKLFLRVRINHHLYLLACVTFVHPIIETGADSGTSRARFHPKVGIVAALISTCTRQGPALLAAVILTEIHKPTISGYKPNPRINWVKMSHNPLNPYRTSLKWAM